VKEGILKHPRLGEGILADDGAARAVSSKAEVAAPFSLAPVEQAQHTPRDFELFCLFVGSSKQCAAVAPLAPAIAGILKGAKKTSFWMLWPSEWDDFEESDYAGYVQTGPCFASMAACEAAGIRSSFPHPAAQYEMITSKRWLATLAPEPKAALPAAVLVEKDEVLRDPLGAAQRALVALERIRAGTPLPASAAGRPSPSVINKNGIRKGVAKLGWSWEARFVSTFVGEKQLAKALKELLLAEGCLATDCIVQEWVDFDFEMRLFFLPPADWKAGTLIQPVKYEFNGWSKKEGDSASNGPGAFVKLNHEKAVQAWGGDEKALEDAQTKAIEVSQFLLEWLCTLDPEPVPFIRLDFMLLKTGEGQARVIFGEYCELGACCIAWKEGPPTIWRSALDYALR